MRVPVSSVKKAMDLLDRLAFEDVQNDGIALSELARRQQQPVNSVHNLLKSLAACGYVSQNAEGRYTIGPKCRRLGQWNRLQAPETLAVINEILELLGRETGEGVVFTTLLDGQWVGVARRSSDQAIRVRPDRKHLDNIYTLSTGRVLTAYADAEELARIIDRHGLPESRWDELDTPAMLEKARAAIRRRGYELIRQEGDGTIIFAVPVLAPGAASRLLGALGCFAPLFRCPEDRLQELLNLVQAAAGELARRLA